MGTWLEVLPIFVLFALVCIVTGIVLVLSHFEMRTEAQLKRPVTWIALGYTVVIMSACFVVFGFALYLYHVATTGIAL